MIDLKKHTNIALAYFLMVGLLGITLRLFFVTPIGANFRYITHAHSHIALLGWVYFGLTTLIYKLYFTRTGKAKRYRRIFWFTNITLLGMLFSFPFQGYALFSITFSTLFLIASYFLAHFVFKNIPEQYKQRNSYKCIKAALWYMVISSIGPWAIGGVMATLGNTSIWYKLSIYLYLHFQYNAWFILALIGVFFYVLETFRLEVDRERFNNFFLNLNAGLILTVFLSGLWVDPPGIFYILGGVGAVFQIMAFRDFFKIVRSNAPKLKSSLHPMTRRLLTIAAFLLIGKVVMQLVSSLEYFVEVSFQFPDLIIGYLHWVFLGVVSLALFGFLLQFRLIKFPKYIFWTFLSGFALSELLIFYKGTAMWLRLPFFAEYFQLLVVVSALIPMAVGWLLIENLKK